MYWHISREASVNLAYLEKILLQEKHQKEFQKSSTNVKEQLTEKFFVEN